MTIERVGESFRKEPSLSSASATILSNGTVLAWGKSDAGGDTNAVAGQLTGVIQLVASQNAFAARWVLLGNVLSGKR